MKTVVSAAPGYYFVTALEDGSHRINDVVPEPVIAWEIEDGFFPWPVTLNRRQYDQHLPWGVTTVTAIVLPDGRVVADLGEAMHATLEAWLDSLAEAEAERVRQLAEWEKKGGEA